MTRAKSRKTRSLIASPAFYKKVLVFHRPGPGSACGVARIPARSVALPVLRPDPWRCPCSGPIGVARAPVRSVPLLGIPVGLAEPGGEGGLFSGHIQVGGIAEGEHAEGGDPFPALFRH